MRKLLVISTLILVFAESFAQGEGDTIIDVHTDGYNYKVYLPEGYEASGEKQWPLLMFLHGIGERGDSLDLVARHGPLKEVESGWVSPFIIIAPQCPAESWWDPYLVLRLLDSALVQYRVDTMSTYLTGLSMGGYGTWETAMRFPNRFAAIVPVCGGGRESFVKLLENTPVWAFHGLLDKAVPVQESVKMIEALKPFNKDVKFTLYPDKYHDCWTVTYQNQELYAWLLSHKLKQK